LMAGLQGWNGNGYGLWFETEKQVT
jgi:hypothetical protein